MSTTLRDLRVASTPLRVPSTTPGRWVYLRLPDPLEVNLGTWCRSSTSGYAVRVGELAETSGPSLYMPIVDHPNLLPWSGGTTRDLLTAALAVEAYLTLIGAEPVPDGEWPEHCVGPGYRADRVPV